MSNVEADLQVRQNAGPTFRSAQTQGTEHSFLCAFLLYASRDLPECLATETQLT